MRGPETKTVSGSTFEGVSRNSQAPRFRRPRPATTASSRLGTTCIEDIAGARADELIKVAGLNRREADAALAALGLTPTDP
jgi:hypothetical protein